jgi:alpha-ketoglutarate-dependent taurine dioxygenase
MLWEKFYSAEKPQIAFDALLSAWQDDAFRVFVLRASTPQSDIKSFFDRHFDGLGTPFPLAEDVTIGDRGHQRSGEIWMEVRYDPRHPDAYRHSPNAQPLHTDGSYIPAFPNATLMCCVASAGKGGETTFISSDDIVDALRHNNPTLLEALSTRRIRHARSGDERTELIIDLSKSTVEVNWNYYCLAPDLSTADRSVCEAFFEFLQTDPIIRERTAAVKMMPGDAVTWKDRQILHGRNGFEATMESERFLWKCAIDIGQFAVATRSSIAS